MSTFPTEGGGGFKLTQKYNSISYSVIMQIIYECFP